MKFPSSHQPHWKGASNRSYVYQVDSKTGLQPLSPCLWVYFGCAKALLLHGLSLVVESGASSPVAVLELLPGEASLVAEQRLSGAWASGVAAGVLGSCGSRAAEHRLRICDTQAQLLRSMWDLPRPGIEPMYSA